MKAFKKQLAVMGIAVFLAGAGSVFSQGQVQSRKQSQHAIHDADSDGICDVCGQTVGSGQANAQGKKANKGKHWGPGDGTGNQGSGPKDGSGYGAQSGQGNGVRDGSGPFHQAGGQNRGQSQGLGRRGGR